MKIFSISILLFFFSNQSFANLFGEKLKLSAISGKAPLKVRILGPDGLTQKSSRKYSMWVGCEFTVDWGDKTSTDLKIGDDCSKNLEHIYSSPGTYKIETSTFHANPDDSHTTDWEDDNKVIVK